MESLTLQVDGPLTKEGLYLGVGGTYNWNVFFFFCLQVDWPITRGGGLITGIYSRTLSKNKGGVGGVSQKELHQAKVTFNTGFQPYCH